MLFLLDGKFVRSTQPVNRKLEIPSAQQPYIMQKIEQYLWGSRGESVVFGQERTESAVITFRRLGGGG
jgi:hypothetical protein